VSPDRKVLRVNLEKPDPLAPRANLDQQDRKVSLAQKDPRVPRDHQDPPEDLHMSVF
jgi:hypothetical protein